MDWSYWNWLNVFCIFFSAYVAIKCWSDGNEMMGHFNAFASVLNGWIVFSRLGF